MVRRVRAGDRVARRCVTATLFSVPPAAVTVIPFDGSAPLAPFPGVIVTTGPAGDGFAEAPAAARPPTRGPARRRLLDAVVVPLPVQAATAAASAAPAARAETARIALMSTLYT